MRTSRQLIQRNDRGAVLIVVAVFAIVAMVMLAFVVDIGGMRERERHVTLSTDAAALAAAGEAVLVGEPTGVQDCSLVLNKSGETVRKVAHDYLVANERTVGLNDFVCEVEVTDSANGSGYVVVATSDTVDFQIGDAIGMESGDVDGASIAAIRADIGGGLRPIGVCNVESTLNQKSPGVSYSMKTDVIDAAGTTDANGTKVLTTPVNLVLEKDHLKKNNGACGTSEASGQRGQLNFDNKNGNGGKCDKEPDGGGQTFAQDIGFGYHGPIPQYVEQDSGNDFNKGTKDCLSDLVNSGERFWLPVYDNYNKSSKSYRITHFVEVEIEGYCLNNDEYQQPASTYACQYPTTAKKKDDTDWFWFKAYGVYQPPSFPSAPPKTSDAQDLPPAICGEENSSAARADCK